MEKGRFQELLFDLLRGVPESAHNARGQKPHTLRDTLVAAVFKVYSTFSARRFSSDLREAHKRGHLSRSTPGMKTTAFMEDEALTPILKRLIGQSSLPLKAVESDFAIDSSGFSTSKFERWFDHKYGVTRQRCLWVPASRVDEFGYECLNHFRRGDRQRRGIRDRPKPSGGAADGHAAAYELPAVTPSLHSAECPM